MAKESFFDDLARGLADGSITRGKALKLMGAAVVGGTLTSFGVGGVAVADNECKPNGKKCRKNKQCCSGKCEGNICVAACPSGEVLCGGSCVSNSCLTGQTFNTTTCQCECPSGQEVCGEGCSTPNGGACTDDSQCCGYAFCLGPNRTCCGGVANFCSTDADCCPGLICDRLYGCFQP